MCDRADFAEDQRYADARWTRRSLVALAGLAALWPQTASAAEVTGAEVRIPTPDGEADAWFVTPAAPGRYPGVLIWPDIFGLRPTFRQMAQRLAESGFAVLVVNPYYRAIRAPVLPEGVDMRSDENFAKVRAEATKLDDKTTATDTVALVAWLDAQSAVDPSRRAGVSGYCMGGSMAFVSAATVPARIGTVASFHGGGLVSDAADSPHKLIPQTRASFLIAIAESDDASEPTAKDVLKRAFSDAGRPAEVEVYPGTRHGWCPPDSKVYHPEQAARAWARWLVLLA